MVDVSSKTSAFQDASKSSKLTACVSHVPHSDSCEAKKEALRAIAIKDYVIQAIVRAYSQPCCSKIENKITQSR